MGSGVRRSTKGRTVRSRRGQTKGGGLDPTQTVVVWEDEESVGR